MQTRNIAMTAAAMLLSVTLSAQQPLRFDFGPGDKAEGFVQVRATDTYSELLGYGFDPSTPVSEKAVSAGDALTGDFVTSDAPFRFSVRLPEGNWKVSLRLGDPTGNSRTTVKAENRRLMLESVETAAGQIRECSFIVNVRTPQLSPGNSIKLNSREWSKEENRPLSMTWDDRLTLHFLDSLPKICSLELEPASEDVVTVFTIGDSTLTDGGGVWAQYLPRWFDSGVSVANHAESGMTIKGFRFGRRWDKVMESAKEGDYLLIMIGCNDQKSSGHDPMWAENDRAGDWVRTHSEASTDYVWGLATMVVEARRHGIIPVIVSPLTKIDRNAAKPTHLMDDYGIYAAKAAELAECPFIDLWNMSRDIVNSLGEGCLKVYSDGTHCADYGGYLFSLCVINAMKDMGMLSSHVLPETPAIDVRNPKPSFEDFTVPQERRR